MAVENKPEKVILCEECHQPSNPETICMKCVLKHVQNRSDFLKKTYPERKTLCAYPKCQNVIDNTEMGDQTLCCYHRMLIDFWFYEENGWEYAPNMKSLDTGKHYPTPKQDPDLATYRNRYQAWAEGLGQEGRDKIVWWQAMSGCNWKL
jgi:ribosomal protein L32